MALAIFVVNQWYGSLGHDYEPLQYFTDRAKADAYAALLNAEVKANGWKHNGHDYTHDVEEITVDDPDVLKRLTDTPAPAAGEEGGSE